MDQHAEEQAAIDYVRRAFERRQTAFLEVIRQANSLGSRQPTLGCLAELEAAEENFKAANANFVRIGEEIRVGTRR